MLKTYCSIHQLILDTVCSHGTWYGTDLILATVESCKQPEFQYLHTRCGSNCFDFDFPLSTIHYHNLKKNKNKNKNGLKNFKPKINLNHNICNHEGDGDEN